MASAQQLNDELIQINAATTEMAATNAEIVADLDALIASGTVSDEHLANLKAAREALQGEVISLKATAAKHTPGSTP